MEISIVYSFNGDYLIHAESEIVQQLSSLLSERDYCSVLEVSLNSVTQLSLKDDSEVMLGNLNISIDKSVISIQDLADLIQTELGLLTRPNVVDYPDYYNF